MPSATAKKSLGRHSSRARHLRTALNKRIHEHPYLAVATGAGAGYGVAIILRATRIGRLIEIVGGLALLPPVVGWLSWGKATSPSATPS